MHLSTLLYSNFQAGRHLVALDLLPTLCVRMRGLQVGGWTSTAGSCPQLTMSGWAPIGN